LHHPYVVVRDHVSESVDRSIEVRDLDIVIHGARPGRVTV
jgi:hypothetical protein